MNWMRANEQSMLRDNALANVVLPMPGTSSSSTWPSQSNTTSMHTTTSCLPMITFPILVWTASAKAVKFIPSPRKR